MSKALALGVVGLTLSASMLALGYFAGSAGTTAVGAQTALASTPRAGEPLDRAAIEEIVREYLVSNPDVFLDVQQALETRERETREVAQRQAISDSSDDIFNAAYDGIVGNPDGDVTVVEFFDYNCGFCKRAMEDMDAMVAADPELRFVLKEFPILGPESRAAHIVSMAFRTLSPDQYGEFHRELLMSPGRANEAAAISAAVALGVSEEDLRREMQNPSITAAFEQTYALADALSVTGTPSYVIGDQLVFGAQGIEALAEKVEAARNSGS